MRNASSTHWITNAMQAHGVTWMLANLRKDGLFHSLLGECTDNMCQSLICLKSHHCPCSMDEYLRPSMLIGPSFYMTSKGERSLRCCYKRDIEAVYSATKGKENRTQPKSFINHLVKCLGQRCY